jgi:hypothetical protein
MTKDIKQIQEWQPIETAPKDQTEIITWSNNEYPPIISWYELGRWCNSQLFHWSMFDSDDKGMPPFPTHWMSLPKLPNEVK